MKKVISIVEDEKDLNELVKRYLEKEGYDVRAYLTYDDAVVHTVDDDVHLWLLDIMLDDKSGFDLIEEIRTRNPQVPVIFMSARDKEFDRIIGLDQLAAIHINDSKNPEGAHKDRHANLGDGHIGFDTLKYIVHHPLLKDIPKILETPYVDDPEKEGNKLPPYKEEIARLLEK